MLEIMKFVLELLQQLSPVRMVWTWQIGLLFCCGRYQKSLAPGPKLIIPGLFDIKNISIVPEIYTTPLQTITLRDNRVLTYSASITVVVRDAAKAYCQLGHYTETIVELAARTLSVGLADADPTRFDPAYDKRDRLIDEQRKTINEFCLQYGLEVTALGLNNFVLGVRTLRLLLDKAVLSELPHNTP